jgi:hypothetical protein
MRWMLFLVVVLMHGCGETGRGLAVGVGVKGGYICNVKESRVELQRIAFEIPDVFLGKPCSEFPDYSDHKPGDWFSVGGRLQRHSTDVVYVDMFAVGLRVDGGRTQTRLRSYLSPLDFIDFNWDQSADKVGPVLTGATWVERVGKRCVRFDYVSANGLMQKRIVEYWCWDEQSGVVIPFTIRGYEVVAPGEAWKVDLEKTIFEPVFSSLQFNTLTEEYKQGIRDERATLCGRHIKSYTERGIGWLTGATVEPKWTPYFLKMCGYDPATAPKNLGARSRRHSIQAPPSAGNF